MNRLFHIETLGCKLNQLDTERIRNAFRQAGYEETNDPALAEVLVVNACSVTGNAEKESRYRFRRLKRINPDATCYFIGCFTVGKPESPIELPADRKFDIPELAGVTVDFPEHQQTHVRPLIQIQTGCNLKCSYCIVPRFRGPSTSVSESRILHQIRQAVRNNRREVVLTGIHIGTWGKDLRPSRSLLDLLQTIEQDLGQQITVRISSLDSNEIDRDLLNWLAHSPMIRPHFHLPLQSGSARILRRMRRRYTTDQYLETLTSIRNRIPDANLGADVIVGFPGETEELFHETRRFITASPLNYLHVFPFSPRAGTPAAELLDPVPVPVRKERVKTLQGISQTKHSAFVNRFIGTSREGVVIYPDTVLTDNYISVKLNSSYRLEPGSAVTVHLDRMEQDGTVLGDTPV